MPICLPFDLTQYDNIEETFDIKSSAHRIRKNAELIYFSNLTTDDKIAALTLYLLNRNVYSCPICYTKLSCLNNLFYHCYIHWDHKPFVCEECDKSYYCIGNLLRHERLIHGKCKD